jgi:hypothetical protein
LINQGEKKEEVEQADRQQVNRERRLNQSFAQSCQLESVKKREKTRRLSRKDNINKVNVSPL